MRALPLGRDSGGTINITVKDGAWSGTPDLFAAPEPGARGACGIEERIYCHLAIIANGYEKVCRFIPHWAGQLFCYLATIYISVRVCHIIYVVSCTD